MAARAKERAARRGAGWLGWIATLGGGALLVVVAFATGVVLGVASEEPTLVTGHLGGRSDVVPWTVAQADATQEDAAGAAAPPPGAAESALAAAPVPPAPVAPPRRERAPLPAVGAGPPDGAYAIQVGAFDSSEAARKMVEALAAKGHASYLAAGAAARDGRWRVRIGPFATRDEAEARADALKQSEKLPTWVLFEEGASAASPSDAAARRS